MKEKEDSFSNSIMVMFVMSLLSIVVIFIYNFALEIVNKNGWLSNFFLKILNFFINNQESTLNMANQYLFSVILIFFPSFLIFYYILEQTKKLDAFNLIYTSVIKRCIAYYTIILVFFGFLQLFFSPISIDELVMGEINNIFIAISLGSLFPYFYLLLDEAKNNNIQSVPNEVHKVADTTIRVSKKKRYDNIYFPLSVLFLVFIFILLFYMYQQRFKWDSEILSLILSTLGILGTFAAASAAAWAAITARNSFIEQSAANERAVKPYLILQDKSYEVDIPSEQHPFMFNWDNGNKMKNTLKEEDNSFLQINNISNGIAKKILVKTCIKNYTPLLEKLNSMEKSENDNISTTVRNSDDGLSILSIEGNLKNRDKVFWGNHKFNLGESVERYTAAVNQNEEKVLIKIPQAFIVLINMFIIRELRNDVPVSLPYLEVNISCYSIQEKKYNFKYYIQFRSSNTNEDIFSGDKTIHFNIKVTED